MKRLLLSLMVIGLVVGVAVGATRALFTDTETSTGNTFTTGTIDIAVDGENPWEATNEYVLSDMKPSYTEYIEFEIENVGSNPADVWKTITVTGLETGVQSEPECVAEQGSWDGSKTCSSMNAENNAIDVVIDYDLYVELYNESDDLVWHQMLYNKDVVIDVIDGNPMYLGMIPAGWYMKVYQSYHMQEATDNWAQGDVMTFDITLSAEQLAGRALRLENKTGDPDWQIISDSTYGTLVYAAKSSTFDYELEGYGLAVDTGYSLIYYADPWAGNHPGALIASGTSDGTGRLSLSGSVELGMDLPHPSDANYPGGAKIWLVRSSDYNAGTKSMTAWNTANYLFETGLITYDDIDL